jgi:hypothetical protein
MKHQMIATLLFSILITISFNGCSNIQQEPKIVMIPQKCVVPYVEPPFKDNTSYTRNKDIIAKAILDYEAMKKYAEKLLAAQEVCN